MGAPEPLTVLPLSSAVPAERGDAARNRALLLDAARRLIAERGADAVSMDDVAAAAERHDGRFLQARLPREAEHRDVVDAADLRARTAGVLLSLISGAEPGQAERRLAIAEQVAATAR